MAPPPPSLPVPRLIDDDAVDPGSESRLPPKARQGAEDPEEDLLRQIEGFVPVPEQMEGQGVDHPLMD
jgi:hypothetical protein